MGRMSTTQTATYCRRYATLACTIAREVMLDQDAYTDDHSKRMDRAAKALALQAGYIHALSLDTAIEVDEWRMVLGLWNDLVLRFTRLCDMNTRDRIKSHMDGFWDTM